MKVQGVFFDLYGTLIIYGDMQEAWSAWYDVFYSAFAEAGLAVSHDAFKPHCQNFFERPEPPADGEYQTVVERRMHLLAKSFGVRVPRDKAVVAIEASIDVWHRQVRLDPEAIEILSEIKRKRLLALISNFDYAPYVFRLLKLHGLDRLFDAVVVSDAVGHRKPDPAIFHHALQRTGLSADRTIHVGDSPEDIEGASACGIRPIWICRELTAEWKSKQYSGVDRISSLKELQLLLN